MAETQTTFTASYVESNPYVYGLVRTQAEGIRLEAARDGEVWWTGRGHHRDLASHRDFAFRVLVAKGELVRDPADARRYIAC